MNIESWLVKERTTLGTSIADGWKWKDQKQLGNLGADMRDIRPAFGLTASRMHYYKRSWTAVCMCMTRSLAQVA